MAGGVVSPSFSSTSTLRASRRRRLNYSDVSIFKILKTKEKWGKEGAGDWLGLLKASIKNATWDDLQLAPLHSRSSRSKVAMGVRRLTGRLARNWEGLEIVVVQSMRFDSV